MPKGKFIAGYILLILGGLASLFSLSLFAAGPIGAIVGILLLLIIGLPLIVIGILLLKDYSLLKQFREKFKTDEFTYFKLNGHYLFIFKQGNKLFYSIADGLKFTPEEEINSIEFIPLEEGTLSFSQHDFSSRKTLFGDITTSGQSIGIATTFIKEAKLKINEKKEFFVRIPAPFYDPFARLKNLLNKITVEQSINT